MSERLEDLMVPPKLLAAIRNEVRNNTEQQLNDLWMVVHSLKDSVGQASGKDPVPDPEIDELKDLARVGEEKRLELGVQLGELSQQIEALSAQLNQVVSKSDDAEKDLQKKLRGLRKKLSHQSGEMPALPGDLLALPEKLQSVLDRIEKAERETSQLGGAAALFESRLVDQESRLLRRLEEAESRLARVASTPSPASSQRNGEVDELSDESLLALPGSVEFSLNDLAKVAIKYNASDLIVRPNSLPFTYLEGDLIPIGQKQLTPLDAYRVTLLALQPAERRQLMRERTFSKLVQYHDARFLLNAYFERGQLAVYVRRLTPPPLSLDNLDLPRALEVSLLEEKGLIVLCGLGMSSLKSLAYALLTPINQQRRARIFTFEDAVNYELPEELSLLSQLQRGVDLESSGSLLRLRPDVLFLQRISNQEDLQVALQLASDRTLVIASCAGSSVISGLQQLVGLSEPENRPAVMAELSSSLRSVLCYRETQASEYLINSAKVRPWLERGDFTALQTAIETGQPGKSKAAPASQPPTREMPLPPPSSETLAPKLTPPPATENAAPVAPVAAPETPPPSKLKPPPDLDKNEEGDDDMIMGWL